MIVQWLRHYTLNAGDPRLITGQGTRSIMPQIKSYILQVKTLYAATKKESCVLQLRPGADKYINIFLKIWNYFRNEYVTIYYILFIIIKFLNCNNVIVVYSIYKTIQKKKKRKNINVPQCYMNLGDLQVFIILTLKIFCSLKFFKIKDWKRGKYTHTHHTYMVV